MSADLLKRCGWFYAHRAPIAGPAGAMWAHYHEKSETTLCGLRWRKGADLRRWIVQSDVGRIGLCEACKHPVEAAKHPKKA